MEYLSDNKRKVLENSSTSIVRSNQIALETEAIGSEILVDLSDQRETLLRTQRRIYRANNNLSRSDKALRLLNNNVLRNKIILMIIIFLEIGIFCGILVIKYRMKK